MNRGFGAAIVASVLAFPMGALAARLLLVHAPSRIAIDLAQPLPVVTAWGAYGGACFATLAATVAVATVALVALLRSVPNAFLERRGAVRSAILALATAGLAGAALFPFTFSSDPYAYAAYGAMAARGLDPYALVPASVHGPTIDAARWQWGGAYPVCVYGPVFVALARATFAATSAAGVGATVAAFRLLAAGAFLASILLLDVAVAGLAARRRFPLLCAYALNPVMLWSVAEGHNDAFVLLAGAAALALATRRGAWILAGALAGSSAAVKAPGAYLALGFGLDALASRGRPRAAAGVAAGLALAALVTVPPLLRAIEGAAPHGRYAPSVSLQALIGLVPALLAAAGAAAYGFVRAVRGDRGGYAWLGLAAAAALPNVYPWYALWLAPWALAAGRTHAALALYGVTICALLRYLPDAAGNMTVETLRLVTVVALLPLALVAVPSIRRAATHRQKAVAKS